MAVVISIKVGAAAAVTKSFADEAKAIAILERFYADHALGADDATPAQKLRAIVDWIPIYIADKAKQRQVQLVRDSARQQAEQDNTFE